MPWNRERPHSWAIVLIALAILLGACSPSYEASTPLAAGSLTALPAPFTARPALSTVTATQTAGLAEAAPPETPATAVQSTRPPETSTPEPTASSDPAYAVTFILPADTLNVRSGPGVDSPVVAELDAGVNGLAITGSGTDVDGSLWVPVNTGETSGWVNSRYLTTSLSNEEFCGDPAVGALMSKLRTAVASQDGAAFAQLVHPQRGLRVRISWWNPEILLQQSALANVFKSSKSYDWGTADGSGLPIQGSFGNVVYPLLQRDLLEAETTSCDDFLHGPTTGLVQLPETYQDLNFISYFRQGEVEGGFDWGTWAVGIEKWQGNYHLSFLVHYAYEI